MTMPLRKRSPMAYRRKQRARVMQRAAQRLPILIELQRQISEATARLDGAENADQYFAALDELGPLQGRYRRLLAQSAH